MASGHGANKPDTSGHPGRQVHRDRFDNEPGRETGVEWDARVGNPIPEGFRVSDDRTHYTDDRGGTIHPESPEEKIYRQRKAQGYYN